MSVRASEPKYHPLYNQVGTGIRDFAKANEDWYDAKYAYTDDYVEYESD